MRIPSVVFCLLLLAGCAVTKKPPAPEAVTPDDRPIPGIDTPIALDPVDALLLPAAGGLPDPDDPASFEPTYSPEMTLTARYRIEPTAGGKKLQSVLLFGEDGRVYSRAYRPIPGEYGFADKRVTVTGRAYVNSPYVQSVGGLHFEVKSITLAPGEAAMDPAPTALPAPPLARTAEAALAAADWYVTCVGGAEGDVFTFVDGGTLPIAPGEAPPSNPLLTLLSQVRGGALSPVAVCEGEAPRCGITEPE